MRRYLRISLRALLVGMLACGATLGVVVDRAQRQRAAAAAIEKLGVNAFYDGLSDDDRGRDSQSEPSLHDAVVGRLAELLGRDNVCTGTRVFAYPEKMEACLPHLRRLPGLKRVTILTHGGIYRSNEKLTDEVERRIRRTLPNCEVDRRTVYLWGP